MRDWLYFLVDEEGKSYTMQNGVLKKVSQRTPLTYTPDGWQDISIGWERDLSKIGIVRNFSIPLGFVMDGAEILRNIFYKNNVEAKVYLVIQKLEVSFDDIGNTYKFSYKFFYKGELDLSTFKDELTKVTVRVMEGGLAKQLKANEGTVYEFPMDDPEAIIVKMDGIFLEQSIAFLLPTDDLYVGKEFLGIIEINKEGTAYGLASFSVYEGDAPASLANNVNYFLTTALPIDNIKLSGSILVRNAFDTTIKLIKEDNTVVATIVDVNGVGDGSTYEDILIDVTFNAAANDKFYLVVESFLGAIKESKLKVTYKSRKPESYIKAFKPIDLYKKLGAKVTGNANNVSSTVLEANEMFVLTSGDAVRGISTAKLKTNLNNFFEDSKVRYGAGMGIENKKIVIEEYAHFLDETNPVALGNAKDLNISPSTDLMANTIKIGYNEKNIDDVNGKYSFNNTHLYSSPITRIVKEQTLISPYITDPFVIELTRLNLEGKTTTDNSKDNEVMVLHVEETVVEFTPPEFLAGPFGTGSIISIKGADDQQPNFQPGLRFYISGAPTNNGVFTVLSVGNVVPGFGFMLGIKEVLTAEDMTGATVNFSTYTLARPAYDSLTGVPDPETIFNVELSPKRIAEKQRTWLQSMFAGFDLLTFQTTERNADLKTVQGSVTIEEKANIVLGSEKLFQPCYFEFDNEVPTTLTETLETNPNKAFSFQWDGLTWIGFLMKAGIAPNTNKEQAFKLLAAPSNDLKKLI